MYYAKLASDGTVERYPYTLTDLKIDNPGTSFPADISDDCAAAFQVFPVTPTDPPADADHTGNLERTAVQRGKAWVEQWSIAPATAEQIAERTAAQAAAIRAERNQRLAACDWTQMADAPTDQPAWRTYRTALRNISMQVGFPWTIEWPVEP